MPSILVSGPVRGDFAALFKAVAKAQKKGEFAAALCVGNFLGETREAPADATPLPVYVVTGEDAIDADLASRLAAKNVRWLGRSGCEDVAGLRVGFLGGTYDETKYDEAAPDDRSDAPHYTCDDVSTVWKSPRHRAGDDSAQTRRKILISTQVEQLAIDTGAYRNDGGCDVLLTSDAPRGCDATLTEDDPRRAQIGACSKPLGEAMRSIKTSYHFVAAADEGWSLEPYRCGVGGHRRLTRLHALPACGKKRWLRAFTVEPFASVTDDLDTEEGARAASVRAGELRAATANPYVVADAAASHKPPPGMTKHVPMAAAAAQEEDEEAAAAVLADAAPAAPPEDNAPVVASFPTAFGGRGQKTKHETQVVSAPRPVYTAPNRPPEAAPKEKKPKRQSIYANQNGGLANPKKGKRKRWGDPGGQF